MGQWEITKMLGIAFCFHGEKWNCVKIDKSGRYQSHRQFILQARSLKLRTGKMNSPHMGAFWKVAQESRYDTPQNFAGRYLLVTHIVNTRFKIHLAIFCRSAVLRTVWIDLLVGFEVITAEIMKCLVGCEAVKYDRSLPTFLMNFGELVLDYTASRPRG
jgi:hypothetical protein